MRSRLLSFASVLLCLWMCAGCVDSHDPTVTLRLCASSVGHEGELLRAQLARFEGAHPHIKVELEETPDAADQRHQLYVQWLNAKSPRPDVLQLDIIWTAEFAAAGWLSSLPEQPSPGEFFEATLEANTYQGSLYALPWFVDVGMLYYRSDLLEAPPASLAQVKEQALAQLEAGNVKYGLVWQNARYEGLVTSYLEVLGAFGGTWLDASGVPVIDSAPAMNAAAYMRDLLSVGVVPRDALGWQEEQTRFAFQNGHALFMRNWPYARALLEGPDSSVKGRFGVVPMPSAPGGARTATLGGAQLGISRFTQHRHEAVQLLRFLTAPAQMIERAQVLGHLPPRPALFATSEFHTAFGSSAPSLREIVESARPRPPHPLYSELSSELASELHRALSGQISTAEGLASAQARMLKTLAAGKPPPDARVYSGPSRATWAALLLGALLCVVLLIVACQRRGDKKPQPSHERRALAWLLGPVVTISLGIAVVPLLSTTVQALFVNDLRMPSSHQQSPTLANFRTLFDEAGFWQALWHTLFFLVVSVGLEMCLGLTLALALHRKGARASLARPLALLPWAVPTVVVGLIFRFLVEGPESLANQAMTLTGLAETPQAWLAHSASAWATLIVADVWKTTPFVALLLLAALTNIDRRLYEAAALDGAHRLHQLRYITLPALAPTLLVVLLFRALDALKVFDLVYTLTRGGPGTATEPLALYTFNTFFTQLKFGEGAALSLVSVLLAVLFSLALFGGMRLGRSE